MAEKQQNRTFLGFGANLGNPLTTFRIACRALAGHPQVELLRQSPLYRTPAVGGPSRQPDYLNGVVELTTSLSPTDLLQFCQQLENSAGRTREVRWGARTLDIDLLFYADRVSDSTLLILPHPRLHQRHFVLLPLTDLEPSLEHPRLQKTVRELLAELPEASGITQLKNSWMSDD